MSRLRSIPSCGLSLLKAPANTFDYVLRITANDQMFVRVHCHRSVLLAHSQKFRELITNENFFDMDIKVNPGYVAPTLELLQYMYLKDPDLITHQKKVLELTVFFEMPLDHFLIREQALEKLNDYPSFHIYISSDSSSCIIAQDFLRAIRITGAFIQTVENKPLDSSVKSVASDTSISNVSLDKVSSQRAESVKGHIVEDKNIVSSSSNSDDETISVHDDNSSCSSRSCDRVKSSVNKVKVKPIIKKRIYNLRSKKH